MHFEDYGLKRLITTCYKNQDVDLFSTQQSEQAVYLVYDGDKNGNGEVDWDELDIRPLKGDGDFRSQECVELLQLADIVVTNPPFSLFREYVAQLMKYQKKFLIIGNVGAISYKEFFPLIKENKVWMGISIHSGDREFMIPTTYEARSQSLRVDDKGNQFVRVVGVRWFTNLDYSIRHEPMILYKKYTPEEYPQYDNYEAIDVAKSSDIPCDYYGMMGVPLTFLDKYCPDQFEILGMTDRDEPLKRKTYTIADSPKFGDLNRRGALFRDGTLISTYARILIRRKQ